MAAQSDRRGLFERAGYVRVPNAMRRERDGARYKKGWEVRPVALDEAEAERLRDLARACHFEAGRTFRKHSRWIVPIYGEVAVIEFRETHGRMRAAPGEAISSVRAEIHDLVD